MSSNKNYLVDYHGFVYLWRDHVHKKYYIGSHLGSIHDHYIGSNNWLKNAYQKRPHTFTRRIIQWLPFHNEPQEIALSRLHELEQRWLDMIDDKELSISKNVLAGTNRYYNMKKTAAGGSHKGQTKNRTKPAWNIGISSEMLKLRREGQFCLLSDKPQYVKKLINLNNIRIPRKRRIKRQPSICPICNVQFLGQIGQKTCSRSCSGKRLWQEGKISPQCGTRKAWNKGLPNPLAAENGIKGAQKLREKIKGRKLIKSGDGKKHWVYPGDQNYPLVDREIKKKVISPIPKKVSPDKPPLPSPLFQKDSPEWKEFFRLKVIQNAKRGLEHASAWLWVLKNPDGQIFEVIGLVAFCRENNLSITALQYNYHARNSGPITRGKSKGWQVIDKRKGNI